MFEVHVLLEGSKDLISLMIFRFSLCVHTL